MVYHLVKLWLEVVYHFSCLHHSTVLARHYVLSLSVCLSVCLSVTFVYSSGQILLPRYLMNGLSNLEVVYHFLRL